MEKKQRDKRVGGGIRCGYIGRDEVRSLLLICQPCILVIFMKSTQLLFGPLFSHEVYHLSAFRLASFFFFAYF
jgi:hypothetical protein